MEYTFRLALTVGETVNTAATLQIYVEYRHGVVEQDGSAEPPRVGTPTLVISQSDGLNLPMAVAHEVSLTTDPRLKLGAQAQQDAGPFRPLLEFAQGFLGGLPSQNDASRAATSLSERELEVLEHIARGESNPAIAECLTISPRTVERHCRNIYTKLGVHNRVQAANWAREHGVG
jgi:DNA-binding CsgD family transcriptional regulator